MFHVNESANVWKYFKVTPFHNKGLLSELIMIIREQQFSLIAPKTQIHNSASSDVQAAFDFSREYNLLAVKQQLPIKWAHK